MCGEMLLGLQGFGVGASTVGAYYSAQSQKSSLNASANLADINAKISEMGAQAAILSGQQEEQQSRLNTARIKSSQRVAMAANGIDLSSTSAAAVLTSTDTLGEIEVNNIVANASRAAFGYRVQGVGSQNEALIKRSNAKAIKPFMAATDTLFNTATTVSSSWYNMNKAGTIKSSNNYGPQNDMFSRTLGQHNLLSDALY